MSESAFDRWLATEPGFKPIRINSDTELLAEELRIGATFAAADEATCRSCSDPVGVYLVPHPFYDTDVPRFRSFWILDEDYERLVCEDCWEELSAEVS